MIAALVLLVGITVLGLVTDLSMVAWSGTRLDHATDAAAHAALDCWDRNTWSLEHRVVLDPVCAQAEARRYLGRNLPGGRLDSAAVAPANRVTVQASARAPHLFGAIWGEGSVTLKSLASATRGSG